MKKNFKTLGKLLSQLFMMTAVFTSCQDDDFADSHQPLQVSVTANSPMVSRAIVTDEYLPDGSTIGVSLFAADGSSYDNQNYFNVKYTASGTGDAQTWTGASAVSLSTTVGKAIAYYPWQDVADLTAVPVETASQTDYMYSKPVTGLSLASPTASFSMQHALTDIRVKVIRGDYTGTGALESVSVKSAAFATDATLNVHDGSLTSVSGTGTEFKSEYTDKTITAEGFVQDYLVVPVAFVTSGDVSVFVVIDGKKFAASVPYSDAFLQGKTYIYEMTLDNKGLSLIRTKVTPWNLLVDVNQSAQFYDDQYVVKIAVPSDNYTYRHNVGGFVGTIDWGDGTKSDYTTSVTYPTHNYNIAGNYTVIAEGEIEFIESHNFSMSSSTVPSKIITKLLRIGKEMKVSSMNNAFYNQTLLSEIAPGALEGCAEVTSFYQVFYGCSNLQTIPEGLFDKCTEVTSFESAFRGCHALKIIPVGLFDKCTEVQIFKETFQGCTSVTSIPSGLFDKCTKVTNFVGTFYYCTNLTAIPEGLFDNCTEVTKFDNTFGSCNKLQGVPVGLFDNCTKVTSFEGTFYWCTSLQAIPEGLFDKCTEVTSFYQTFRGCSSLTAIPVGLFDYNTKVTEFGSVFGSTGITSIPEGLFDNNTEVASFSYAFEGCTGITSIPERLFDKCTEVTSFSGTFTQTEITSIPEGLFDKCTKVKSFNGTFQGCTSLQTIQEGLFDKCTEVTSFGSLFNGCGSLETIPEGLFDKCTEVTDFSYTFQFCKSLTGESPYTTIQVDGVDTKVHLYERSAYPDVFTAPTSYSRCFYNCTGVTDYANIPTDWE